VKGINSHQYAEIDIYMVVQHNIPAQNANRYLDVNTGTLSKTLEKLSSGYQINRAGDNAAGLAVSEKMRAQISGISQAINNAGDGISMIQTYEGALTETHAILNRIKTLAVQSSNGTYTDETDRAASELEYEQLVQELDDISETDFNGIAVLGKATASSVTSGGGTGGSSTSGDIDVYGAIYNMWFDAALTKIKATTGLEIGKDMTVNVKFDSSLGSGAVMACSAGVAAGRKGNEISILINPSFYATTTKITDENGIKSGGAYTDNVIAHELVHGLMQTMIDGAYYIASAPPADLPGWFMEGIAEAAVGNDRFADFNPLAVIAGLSPIDYALREINNLSMTSTGGENYTAGSLFIHYLDNYDKGGGAGGLTGGGAIKRVLGILTDPADPNNGSLDLAFTEVFGKTASTLLSEFKTEAMAAASGGLTTFNTFLSSKLGLSPNDGNPQEAITQAGTSEEDGVIESSLNVSPVSATETKTVNGHTVTFKFDLTGSGGGSGGSGGAVTISYTDNISLQVGARTKDLKRYDFNYAGVWGGDATLQKDSIGTLSADINATATGLGLVTATVNLASQKNANAAIDIVDNAINKVSMIRGTFGSIQNRLEHKIDNLGTTNENLTAAESRIRDTDMASEMMKFTKQQIIMQASQSMLAQANQLPSGTLQLLQ
jgi:flagellin